MAKTLTAADRKALIRLASTMEQGSPERRAILAGLSKTAAIPTGLPGVSSFINYSSGSVPREAQEKIWKAVSAMLAHAGGVQDPSGRQEFIGVRFGPGDQLYGKDGDGLSFWFNLTGNLVKGQGAARVLAPALNVPASAIRVGYKWSKGGFGVRDGHGEWALSENLFTVSIGKRGLKAGFRFW